MFFRNTNCPQLSCFTDISRPGYLVQRLILFLSFFLQIAKYYTKTWVFRIFMNKYLYMYIFQNEYIMLTLYILVAIYVFLQKA